MATHSSILTCGEFHGQRSLVGYSPWDCKELNTTDYHFHFGSAKYRCQDDSRGYLDILKLLSKVLYLRIAVILILFLIL